MIVIEVTNSREVVRQRVGRLGERLIGTVVDAEAQVEKALLQELKKTSANSASKRGSFCGWSSDGGA